MLHESIRELVSLRGDGVLEDAEELRGALDDFLEEREATLGELNLIVDAVRLGGVRRLLAVLDHGGESAAAVQEAGAALARDRGSDDARRSTWAVAVLGFALGRVEAAEVDRWVGPSRAAEVLADPAAGGTQPTPPPETDQQEQHEQPSPPTEPAAAAVSDRPPGAVAAAASGAATHRDARGDGPTWDHTPPPAAPAAPTARRSRRGLVAVVALVVLVAVGGVVAWRLVGGSSDTSADDGSDGGRAGSATPLPDDRLLVSYATDAGSGIYSVDPESGENDIVVEGQTDQLPAISPDRRTIAFLTIPVPGSAARQVYVTDPAGQEPERLFEGPPCEYGNRPAWSPDGSQIALVCADGGGETTGIFVAGPDGSDLRMVVADTDLIGAVTWVGESEIVYTREQGGTTVLWSVDVDSDTATELPLDRPPTAFDSHPDWSPEAGLLLFTRAYEDVEVGELWTYDPADGAVEQVELDRQVAHPVWSPDGTRVACVVGEPGAEELAYVDLSDPTVRTVPGDAPGEVGIPVWASR